MGVFGPSLPRPSNVEGWVRQFPDTLVVAVPMFGDGLPGHFGSVATDTAHTTLTRDGRQVAESSEPGYVLYDAPAADASYRMDTELTQHVFDTSTRIIGSWRFRSRPVPGPGGVLLTAMAVRFKPNLDDANRAPAGVPFTIPVSVQDQSGAPVTALRSLTVEASYDDGQSWQRVPLVRAGTGWTALVRHPAAGFVSLRARASDAAGNEVDQTIIRAYGLRTR